MSVRNLLIWLTGLLLGVQSGLRATPGEIDVKNQDTKLRAMIAAWPKLPLKHTELVIKLPEGKELGMVSWPARDSKTGVAWPIQRGDKALPVIAVAKEGRVLRSFDKGRVHDSARDPARPRGQCVEEVGEG